MYVSDFSILLSPMVCAHSFLLKKLLEKGDLTWGREAYHPVGIALCQISAWARLCHVDAEGAAGVRRPRPGSAVSLSRRAGVRDEPVASAETSARRWQGSGRTPGQRRVRGYSGAPPAGSRPVSEAPLLAYLDWPAAGAGSRRPVASRAVRAPHAPARASSR